MTNDLSSDYEQFVIFVLNHKADGHRIDWKRATAAWNQVSPQTHTADELRQLYTRRRDALRKKQRMKQRCSNRAARVDSHVRAAVVGSPASTWVLPLDIAWQTTSHHMIDVDSPDMGCSISKAVDEGLDFYKPPLRLPVIVDWIQHVKEGA
tara:strand:- start:48 stop:500 length:453 start_codon:yes stop_codon:yes gene_type:complete